MRIATLVWTFLFFAAGAPSLRAQSFCAETPNTEGAAISDYRPVFELCTVDVGKPRLAIRRMAAGDEELLLTVDPESLSTRLERAPCWRCAATSDVLQGTTRFLRALRASEPAAEKSPLENAGLTHGKGEGAFVTGDLCPSARPLDRGFLQALAAMGPRTPVALAVSGVWIKTHAADLDWLKQEAGRGALDIAWVNHSYHHPYARSRPEAKNFLLTEGVDMDAEILETEKLMIANGLTPSVFFRFPGLVSDPALLDKLRERHLVALGADAWIALGPRPRAGSIVLVHPNGNEEIGLRLFGRLVERGQMPKPLRAITEAP